MNKLIFFFFFSPLVSCYNPLQEESLGSTDHEIIRQRNQNRDQIIRRTSELYAGQKCSTEEKSHKCYESCNAIYRRNQKDCKELTVGQIEKLQELHSVLREAGPEEWLEIETDLFELYLSFSIKAFDDIIDDLRKKSRVSKAEDLMIWLVSNEDKAEVFEAVDRNYKTLNKLLQVIEPFESYEVYLPFSKVVNDSDTLIDIIVRERDETDFVFNWILDFIEESSVCKGDPVSVDCFEVYCKIGSAMNKKEQNRLLEKDIFENYIDDILQNSINRENWNPPSRKSVEDLEETSDLRDKWVEILCGDLT